jgi:hypothetical protein
MLEYRKTGGIAGVDEILSIADDGKAWLRRSTSGEPEYEIRGRLDPSEVQELRALAEGADFSELKDTEPEAYDQLSYEVTYRSRGEERRIRVGATDVPVHLQPLVGRLDSIALALVRANKPM